MALQFTPSDEKKSDVIPAEATVVDTSEASKELNLKITEPQTYSIIDTANELKQELASSEEIDKLVSTINANDPNSIITFGNQVAEEISKASDQVLNSMNMTQLDDSSELLNALKNIMDQFDVKELTEEKKAGFFANLRKQLDKILAKYHTMGEEVDKIYVQLKQYESEISQSNIKLETMYNANIEYYKELLKYIMAGEQACKELDQYIEDFKVKVQNNPDSGTAAMDLQTLEQTRSIMEQRVMDLKIAKNELMQFVAGVVMLAVGLYIFSQKVIVFSGYGFFFLGGGRFSSGLIIIPLIIGIVWMFMTGACFASKVFTALSVLLIIVSVIMSTHIHLSVMTLYEWILLLVLIFGGAGLVGKVLFSGSGTSYREKKASGKDKNKGYKDTFSNGKSIDDEIEKMKKNIK